MRQQRPRGLNFDLTREPVDLGFMKILLISATPALRQSIPPQLEVAGFLATLADEDSVDKVMEKTDYDAIIIEPNPDDASILSLIPFWRRQGLTAGVFVILEENTSAEKRIQCLDLGADAHLIKPVDTAELIARLNVLARRHGANQEGVYRVDGFEIDGIRRTATREGKRVQLTPREFDVLDFLVRRRGKVVTRSMLQEHLFDRIGTRSSNIVDVYIRCLRKKIDQGFSKPLIITHWGQGYEFRTPPEPNPHN